MADSYDYGFLFAPWEDIYQMDEERDHTLEYSIRAHESTQSWYLQLGYQIIEVPIDESGARAEFILECVAGG